MPKSITRMHPTETMLDASVKFIESYDGRELPRQRTKKMGARDVPRDKERFAPCRKCNGSGIFNGYSHLGRRCFQCNGTGNGLSLSKNAVAGRERAARKIVDAATKLANDTAAFKAANPDVVEWMASNPRFEFASSLSSALNRYGMLTPNQLAAARKCIDNAKIRDAAREAERKANAVSVGGAGFDKLLSTFAKAKASGLKYPALQFDGLVFKPASATGKNAGFIYVTEGRKFGSAYFGKIDAEGNYSPSRDASDAIKADVARIGADPTAAAVAYGKKTGVCCCCGAELTNAVSIEYGIGPICREKWGM